MSAVPLMKLHNSNRTSGEARDSDQMSDEEDDPLESVLARMKYRPQHRSQDFYSTMILTGVLCLIIGFLASYVTFISTGRIAKTYLNDNQDADPQVATYLLTNVNPSNVDNFLSDLNKPSTGNISNNEYQAHLLLKHFTELDFDSVSVKPSSVLLSFYDRSGPNRVSIVDRSKDNREVESFYSNESAYFSTPDGLRVSYLVEGAVVYVNFGQDSDYEYLMKLDIYVKDVIVLARLGRVSPVNLVDNALRRGAKGVILFADPQQYPPSQSRDRPFLWPSQLGLLQVLHGNPSTKTRNVNGKDSARTNCVPVQVIKPHDAQQILIQMSSNNQSHKSWLGDLKATTYPMGPGFSTQNYRLRMEINAVNVEKVFYNVVAAVRGETEPDRYVLLGSDREPLTSLSSYPLEGTATIMEFARVLSTMRKSNNWRPRRTLVFCSWGVTQTTGQFQGAPLNSEWLNLLDSRVVAYLNIDASNQGNGSFTAHGSPILSKLMFDASSLVPYASSKASVYEIWLQETLNTTAKYPMMGAVTSEEDLQTLLHNQGIPNLHFQFTHSQVLGKVDSSEDSLTNHKAAVQLWGMLTWKLADSLILPFDVRQYSSFLVQSVAAIEAKYKGVVASNLLPLGILRDAVKNFSEVAETFHKKVLQVDKTNTLTMRIMNDQLLQLERAFLHHSPSWRTRHIVLAPGASISNDASFGFGALQDQLAEISSSPIASELHAVISDHILSLVHCIKSAISVLDEPLSPLKFSDFY